MDNDSLRKIKVNPPSITASSICHELKWKGDKGFIEWIESSDVIDECFKTGDMYATLYYVSMYEYLCNKLKHKKSDRFTYYYSLTLIDKVYQPDVYLLDAIYNNTKASEDALSKAIPEFLEHNIVETDVYDAV